MKRVWVDWNRTDEHGNVVTISPCEIGERVIADDMEGTSFEAVVFDMEDFGRGPFWMLQPIKRLA
jgi:hypothetical protein